MSIQSDRWIREQAIQHRMIEPFSEKQVAATSSPMGSLRTAMTARSDEFKISPM